MQAPLLLWWTLTGPALAERLPDPASARDRAPRDALAARAPTLNRLALDAALASHACAEARGELSDGPASRLVTVVDYSLPSHLPRLWVLDVASGQVLFHERVAHGQGSGGATATAFSNAPGSHQTSLGVFRTAETYVGKHGRSLRLDGLEPGHNDRARERAIVVHAADYATGDFVARHGRLGRSWGCPALRPEIAQAVIDTIAEGSLFVAWYPDDDWLEGSGYLHCAP